MKILFVGDIVGRSGRNVVLENLKTVKDKYKIDFTIANGENAAHGKGITGRIYQQLKEAGIDCITLGNHAFSKSSIKLEISELDDLIRPINLEPLEYGQYYKVYDILGKKLCVTNIMGEVFMDRISCSPFESMNRILANVKADIYIVDFHGETTSEKIAFAYHYSHKVQAVLGTHTHVQTADERILGDLAFISDVGMCGAYTSIIGRDINEVINNMVHGVKTKFEVAIGNGIFQAVCIEIDESKNTATSIERIQIRPSE